jgi:hypothetical protein
MKPIVKAFLNEPVVVLLSINAVIQVASMEGWVPEPINLVVLAVTAVLLRHFVTPDRQIKDIKKAEISD